MKGKRNPKRRPVALTLMALLEAGLICLALSASAWGGASIDWIRRYNGPAKWMDYGKAMALDNQGNVYVTGSCAVSTNQWDCVTLKYNPSGTRLWVRSYNGPGNNYDEAKAIAVDSQANVYVTGSSPGAGTGYDYVTIKYDTNGTRKWARRYNGPGNSTDEATAIAVDSQGNVYVTGYSMGSGTNFDYATVKYDTNGTEKWVKRYNGPANSEDMAKAIAVDSQGNVYVTGGSAGSTGFPDYATIKYDTGGNRKWVKRYSAPGNNHDAATAIAVDSQANVYVTGYSPGAGTGNDYVTIKYDTEGVWKWTRRYSPTNTDDMPTAIALDGQGNVYVTGYTAPGTAAADYATVKYSPIGQRLWVKTYNGPGNQADHANGIAVDGQGNVYVTGSSVNSAYNFDCTTIKYQQTP